METLTPTSGSAARWGPLWGARARDWAANEERQAPTYERAIEMLGIVPGQRALDIGCGTGAFLSRVADRGAIPFGLDASQALIEIARERLPEADLRVGEMEHLPHPDDHFDLVTGFNSFFFAADMTAALREARRVARPGSRVLIQVWGAPERNDLEAMKRVARRHAPPPPDAPPPPQLWREGALEELAAGAGLEPENRFTASYSFEYPDEDTLGRLLMAPMGLAELVGPAREAEVRREIVEALQPFRTADGRYSLRNEFAFLITRA